MDIPPRAAGTGLEGAGPLTPNTDPQAIAFTLDHTRQFARLQYAAYVEAKAMVTLWNQRISTLILATDDLIVDGVLKAPLTGNFTNFVIQRATALIADLEANGNAHLYDLMRAIEV